MNLFLLAAGAVVVAGGIACATARGAVTLTVGVALLLGVSPLVADPLPASLLLAERVVGAGLAAELLWVVARGRSRAATSALPWPAVAFLAAAAFAAGIGLTAALPTAGPPEALATAVALATVATVVVTGRPDGVHLALAALLLVAASTLVRVALVGPASSLEALIVAALGLAVVAVAALLIPPAAPATPAAVPTSTSAERR